MVGWVSLTVFWECGVGNELTATGLHFGDQCVGCCGWMPMIYLCSVRAVFAGNCFFVVAL